MMEFENTEATYTRCQEKMNFILNMLKREKIFQKQHPSNFLITTHNMFSPNLKEALIEYKKKEKLVKGRNTQLEDLEYSLGKYIQLVVHEAKLDRERIIRPGKLGIEQFLIDLDENLGKVLLEENEEDTVLFNRDYVINIIKPRYREIKKAVNRIQSKSKGVMINNLREFSEKFYSNDDMFLQGIKLLKSIEDAQQIVSNITNIFNRREFEMKTRVNYAGISKTTSNASKILKNRNASKFFTLHLYLIPEPFPYELVSTNIFTFLEAKYSNKSTLGLLQKIKNIFPTPQPKTLSLKAINEFFMKEKVQKEIDSGSEDERDEFYTSEEEKIYMKGNIKYYTKKQKEERKIPRIDKIPQKGKIWGVWNKEIEIVEVEKNDQDTLPYVMQNSLSKKELSFKYAAPMINPITKLPSLKEGEESSPGSIFGKPSHPESKTTSNLKLTVTHANQKTTEYNLCWKEFTEGPIYFGRGKECKIRIKSRISNIQGEITYEKNNYYMTCRSSSYLTRIKCSATERTRLMEDNYIFLTKDDTYIIEGLGEGSVNLEPYIVIAEYCLNGFRQVIRLAEDAAQYSFGISHLADYVLPRRSGISGIHFRIGYDPYFGWYLLDGSIDGPSTNGTSITLKNGKDFLTNSNSHPFLIADQMHFIIEDSSIHVYILYICIIYIYILIYRLVKLRCNK